jgi:hypothetical protein
LLAIAESEYKWRLSVYQQIAAMKCDVNEEEKTAVSVK